MDLETMWSKCLHILKNRSSEQVYRTWFKPLSPQKTGEEEITLIAPNKFFMQWVTDRYKGLLQESVKEAAGRDLNLNITYQQASEEKKGGEPGGRPAEEDFDQLAVDNETLNPRYTFENFVVGECNRFAHAAALAVATAPAMSYNPLFIYGGAGLGKTHLLNSIGHRVLQKYKHMKVRLLTAERFMNEMINAIRYKKTVEFKQRYRSVDVLLIDDIQFISGKESTQREFFHTFNSLYESNKQIVITSDKFPHSISGLEERLRSRFGSGLIVDIQPPDTETKVAILEKKAMENGIDLPKDVAIFLASNDETSIRELEGNLIRIGAFASINDVPITVELAKKVLTDLMPSLDKGVTIGDVIDCTAQYFSLKPSDLKSHRRFRTFAFPRQVAMYMARTIVKASFAEIGASFGGKDHSTVIHAVKKIEKREKEDPKVSEAIKNITRLLQQRKRG